MIVRQTALITLPLIVLLSGIQHYSAEASRFALIPDSPQSASLPQEAIAALQNSQQLIEFVNTVIEATSQQSPPSRVEFAKQIGTLESNKYGEIDSKYELQIQPHNLPFASKILIPKPTSSKKIRNSGDLTRVNLVLKPQTTFDRTALAQTFGQLHELVPIVHKPHRTVAYLPSGKDQRQYRIIFTHAFDQDGKKDNQFTEIYIDFLKS